MATSPPREPLTHRELERRIDTLLGEFRIMTPALAALLGFQLIAAMQSSYPDLALWTRAINFAAVASSALALGFMLVPSAYHRFAPRVHEDESFIAFAQHSLSWGFVFLSLSLTGSLFLQAARSFDSGAVGALAATAALAFLAILWWVYPKRLVRP